jgi:hypothetical protein
VPRLALRPSEAADSLGLSTTQFREKVLPEIRTVKAGTKTHLIPVRELERWLDEHAAHYLPDDS